MARVAAIAVVSMLGTLLAPALPVMAAESGYYRVSGVASDDVLNVRAEPDASAEVVDTLAPDARPVEVLEVVAAAGGEWGRVLASDANGWVSMRFLAGDDPQRFGGTDVPAGLQCIGTEPFWDLELQAGERMRFSAVDIAEASLPLTAGMAATGRNHRFAFVAADGARRMTAMIGRNERCSDGMSDRDYGWRVDLLVEGLDGAASAASYEGCCMLPVSR